MWPFKKKEETVESLMKDCNKLYSDFCFSLGEAHYKSYSDLKFVMQKNFHIMRDYISKEDNEAVLIELLKKFKDQLTFFNKNPFSCDIDIFVQEFDSKHMPYAQNLKSFVDNLKQSNSSRPKI